MKNGIILYGPPASGKDTITAALVEQDPQLVQFARLKIGEGRSQGYRMGTIEQLHQLEAAGNVIYRNDRYNSIYLVDRPGLDAVFAAGQIPIVHLGQIAGINALATGYPTAWLTVQLNCPRAVTEQRSALRGDTDTQARLAAWDATAADLQANPEVEWALHLRTDQQPALESAQAIIKALGRVG
ncbi:guanylate kinase [Streptomyces tateyamensis]|uniref:Guanylate kinase n=1 Tax=Streptomyces tateyamensis TaxID=565073 RepID=A0A2V4NU63_9ACTN|nr:guanylate kinase [Streptomyces tateyamensis]PYC86600.1 guanylate kinase [Streptomyces tateyamensis]